MTAALQPTVYFITAHPDDVAFFMGGTALLLKPRYKLKILCATRGERGRGAPSEELATVREAEERECGALLGASVDFLDLDDGAIYASKRAVERVATRLRESRPKAVFTHGPQTKPDHAAVYVLALQALYLAGLFWETEMYMSLQDGDSRHGRFASLYVNVTPVIEQKRALLACHRSHLQTPEAVDQLLDHDRLLGKLAWCEYAEAYLTGLPLIGERWNRKAGSILLE